MSGTRVRRSKLARFSMYHHWLSTGSLTLELNLFGYAFPVNVRRKSLTDAVADHLDFHASSGKCSTQFPPFLIMRVGRIQECS